MIASINPARIKWSTAAALLRKNYSYKLIDDICEVVYYTMPTK